MKIIGIENEKNNRKINKKKLMIASIVATVAMIAIILFIVYCANKQFREIIDKYVLMKNIVEDSTTLINIDESEANNVYAYDKYICILNKNILKNYNSSGKQEGELTIEISNPIVSTNGKFFLIAEKGKSKVYLLSGNEIIWQKDVEGNIDKMTVNKNGYVAVILSGTTHKSVIQLFDSSGNELFKTYLANTIAMDVDISLDNQYLAFAEINTSGTSVQSIVKIVSIQKGKILYTHLEENSELVTNIKYQDGNRLLCIYDKGIYVIKNDSKEQLVSLLEEGKKVSFADIELSNYAYRVIEKSSLLKNQTSVEIINTSSKKTNIYSIEAVSKEMYSYNDKIAINLGSEVHFISMNGWLIKRYISHQEIKKIVMCNDFAGIVYRNKIEIVNI